MQRERPDRAGEFVRLIMSPQTNHPIPAIVVGSGNTALGALRCLAMAGIPTYVACRPDDFVTRSRFYRPTPGPVRWHGGLGPHAMEVLRAMPLEQAVIVPCADDAALWAAELARTDLGERFRVSTSAPETLAILQDKSKCGEFLERHDIPHPRTFTIDSLADIARVPFDEIERVFVKPADSQSFRRAIGVKALWASSRAEFEDIWRRVDADGLRVIAQEYVPGLASDHFFVDGFRDRSGALTGLFARRRLRLFPVDFGNSSYCYGIPLGEVEGAIDSITRLLATLEYRGIFSAEFKRDAHTGEFRLIEVNTRAWWYAEYAALCGVNVCRMAYEDALGIVPAPSPRDYRVRQGCVNLLADIRAMRATPAHRRPSWWRVLAQWSRSYFHIFRLGDPVPGLVVTGGVLRARLRRITVGLQSLVSSPGASGG